MLYQHTPIALPFPPFHACALSSSFVAAWRRLYACYNDTIRRFSCTNEPTQSTYFLLKRLHEKSAATAVIRGQQRKARDARRRGGGGGGDGRSACDAPSRHYGSSAAASTAALLQSSKPNATRTRTSSSSSTRVGHSRGGHHRGSSSWITDAVFGVGGELPPTLDAATSHVPGVALLSGAQGDVGKAIRALGEETKWLNAGLGAAVAALALLRHLR